MAGVEEGPASPRERRVRSPRPPRPSPVALFWGEDPFLLRLASMASFAEQGVQPTEMDARDWRGSETSDLATPSLWGERRALLVTGCQAMSEEALGELRDYLAAPAPDALCVLTLVSGAKNPPPLAKLVQAGGGLVKHVALKRQDLPRFVLDRARIRQVKLSDRAAQTLVATIGEDTGVLDQAVEQLGTAFPGVEVGPEQVQAQFRGLGEQRVWDLCDNALSGRLPAALVVLRSLFEGRDDPLLILGGIAARIRDLIRVQALPDRMPGAQAAKAAGLRFDWQVRRYRDQARRFTPPELHALHRRVVDADRALKGGAPGEVVLPALVAAMAGEPQAALAVPLRVGR